MKEPTPQEVIRILKHLTSIWKHDLEIKYLLLKYEELEEDLL